MIIGCVITYNDERMLPGCLESIRGHVDRMVVVDGVFATHPIYNGCAASTDDTRLIAQAYGAEWIRCPVNQYGPVAWASEIEKRNAYLVGQEGDWYLNIDTDERLVGALPELEDGQYYAFVINVNAAWVWTPRLWQHKGHMRYEGAHNALWSDDRLFHRSGAVKVDRMKCRFIHLSDFRPAWQLLGRKEHYARRGPLERAYRKAHGI